MLEKPKNREILQLHYRQKEEKLRKRLQLKAYEEKILAKEMEHLEKRSRENFVFRLADNSFPASECDANEELQMKVLPPAFKKFDYPVNDRELLEFKRQLNEKSVKVIKRGKFPSTWHNVNGLITCGEKDGRRVIMLRSFHDRLSDEPRGKTNHHRLQKTSISTCLTHKEWLDSLANDPEIIVSL